MAAAMAALTCSPDAGAEPARHRVDIEGLEFRPATLSVAVGDTVTWFNRDIVPHTVTMAGGEDRPDTVDPGERMTLVMTAGGQMDYRCRFHPTMTGQLEVQ